jgi:hypothetical protein
MHSESLSADINRFCLRWLERLVCEHLRHQQGKKADEPKEINSRDFRLRPKLNNSEATCKFGL